MELEQFGEVRKLLFLSLQDKMSYAMFVPFFSPSESYVVSRLFFSIYMRTAEDQQCFGSIILSEPLKLFTTKA